MPPLLLLQDIHLTFGGTPLLDGAELSVDAGERLCLVGRNGSGKSTLLKIAAGMVAFDSGHALPPALGRPSATCRRSPTSPASRRPRPSSRRASAPSDDPHRARYLLETLGLTGEEEPARLSGGESRRAALARTLAPEPDILLLDEPTNHLDIAAIEGLEETLERIALGHGHHQPRPPLPRDACREATVWLDRGETRRLDKGFADFEAWRDEVLEEEERERHKLDRKIVVEEHWLRYGVSARRKRNQKRLGDLHALRAERKRARAERPARRRQPRRPGGGLSGKLVIEASGVAKRYGDRPIVRDFSIRIERGDRIGIVGPNGAGKTTLINLLTGALAPDHGTVRLGTNLARRHARPAPREPRSRRRPSPTR